MRILIVSQHFSPEITAAALRLGPIASGLAERGHEVEVVCEVPNHPEGIIAPGFRGRAVVRRDVDGYRASHVWVWARPSKGIRTRLMAYGSFVGMAAAAGSLLRQPDIILASSPPLPVGIAGAALAGRHRVPWVLDVRDLWPDVPLASGELNEGLGLRVAERIERYLYSSAGAITVASEPFRSYIAKRGARGPIELLPNGTTRAWLQAGRAEPDRAGAGFPPDRFVWTYAGNLGILQGLETAIEAAGLLGEGYKLVLLGEGAVKGRLQTLAAELGYAAEVEFRAAVEPEQAARLMRASDALLVSLADGPALERCIPSKLYSCGAVRRPVVLVAGGEARRQAEQAGAALSVRPGDAAGLAAAVRSLCEDPQSREELAAGGERLAAANLREDGIERLDALLESVIDAGRRGRGKLE